MLTARGFQVSIVSEGIVLETHSPQAEDGTATGWVASRVNQNFALRVHQRDARRLPFHAKIFIDGQPVSHGVCVGGKRTTIPSNLLKYPGSDNVFIFYALRTPAPSSAGSYCYNPEDAHSEIGTIRLELRRFQQPEGALNPNTHPVTSDPCAVFLFKYRTLSFLKNNGLITLQTEDQPVDDDADDDGDSTRTERPVTIDVDEPVQDMDIEMEGEGQQSSPTDSSAYDPELFEAQPIFVQSAAAGDAIDASATSVASDDGPVVDQDVQLPQSTLSEIFQRSIADSQCDVASFMQNLRKGEGHLFDHVGRWQAGMQLSEAHVGAESLIQAASPIIVHAPAPTIPGFPPLFAHSPKPDEELRDDPELLELEVEHDDQRVELERRLLTNGQKRQLNELRESKRRDVRRRFNRDLSEEDLCLDAVEDDAEVQLLKEKHAQEQANLERHILLHTQKRDMTRLVERKRADRETAHGRLRRRERLALSMHEVAARQRIKREP